MIIQDVLFCPGKSAFYFDDQRAIKHKAVQDGFVYRGGPETAGFRRIRMAGESIGIMLVLADGRTAFGDCAAVQYAGSGGRDPLFTAADFLPLCEGPLAEALRGFKLASFRDAAAHFEGLSFHGRPLHTAIRYGVSQALLDARALSEGISKCEVLCQEYGLPLSAEAVPIFGQSGDQRYEAVDKMILKEVDTLPHGLINNIQDKLGRDGGKLREYIQWVAGRIKALRWRDDYRPNLHFDVYGTVGDLFNNDLDAITDYLASLVPSAGGFPLYIEGPVDMQERSAQVDALKAIKDRLERLGATVRIVADEWCNTLEDIRTFADAGACHMVQIKTPDLGGIQNTVEAVIYCRKLGVEAYQGGTCNETDITARTCVHAAMAARPDLMLAKPGMGFDEGFSMVHNEMQRIRALLKHKQKQKQGGGRP